MAIERVFAMPDLGEGLEEGEIVAWLVEPGDRVVLNQPIVEVETAKATVEIPSPFSGEVTQLHGGVGEAMAVGAPLVTFTLDGDPEPRRDVPVAATPVVRKLAKELGVELETVTGTGPDGRVTAEDVRAASGEGDTGSSRSTVGEDERLVASNATRRTIADTLSRQAAIPQVTTFRTVDCGELEAFRTALGASPLPVVIVALCRTIERHAQLNARWSADGVVISNRVHVGIATDTDRGLLVPVLRDAEARGIAATRDEIRRLAEGARRGSLPIEDLSGATVAVSNTGSYGSEAGTPILSPGTGVTLAIGVIEARAMVVRGVVTARPACTLSCTFDHRVLDGAAVGRALTELVAILTDRDRLGDLPR